MKSSVKAKELIDAEISGEMREAYLNYAMSVIVARALPSAEDGLKPVHRRILWGMNEMGVFHNKQTKKSGRIVGDVMGKYHPHGDASIYDAMVRMAQSWSLRYPLVIGQGNFGSMDGDSAAASRYTEAKMEKISMEIMEGIDKETVPMMKNYDNSLDEPIVMPGKLPSLFLNGASGIAVGMATNIPPHNLNNTCDAIVTYLDNPECEDTELISAIKAPDFPTGGTVSGEIRRIYTEGKGRLILDGKTVIEEPRRAKDKEKIIITEVPYQVNKANLVEQIAHMVRDKKLPDVADLRDESSKGKVRVVIELKKGSESKFTLNRLYKFTNLRTSFNANMLALVDRVPTMLSLRKYVEVYVAHRQSVVRKTKEFDLAKAEKRLHIVDGLLVAQSNIDEVVRLIRAAKGKADAAVQLKAKYNLSDKQTEAILDMKLHQITSLEFDKLKGEEKNLRDLIDKLNAILGDESLILKIIRKDLMELKEKFGDNRKTKLVGKVGDFDEEELVEKKDVVVTITDKGYIKRLDLAAYREQKRGGKGVIGSDLTEGDFVKELMTCSTHDQILFFTDKGKVHWLKAYDVPASARARKGQAIVNLLALKDERVVKVLAVKEYNDFLMMATAKGVVKKIELSAFANPRKGGIKAIKVVETNDTLIGVKPLKEENEVLLVTKKGKAIRFKADEVRPMGRAAAGVTGIKMASDDKVVSLEVLAVGDDAFSILTLTEKGMGKRTAVEDYRLTGRAGKGVINMTVTEKTGDVVSSLSVLGSDNVIITTKKGIVIRTPLTNVRVMGRATQGVRIINLASGDRVSDISRVA
ncbi:DNA gyrase subunit A [Methanococcoides sp. SA1]|nr:DNA gyrase subunit A [Methanococcoides sp. SA1]